MISEKQIKNQEKWLIKKFADQLFHYKDIDMAIQLPNGQTSLQISPTSIYKNYKKIYSFDQVKRIFRRLLRKGIIKLIQKTPQRNKPNFYTLNAFFYEKYHKKMVRDKVEEILKRKICYLNTWR